MKTFHTPPGQPVGEGPRLYQESGEPPDLSQVTALINLEFPIVVSTFFIMQLQFTNIQVCKLIFVPQLMK